MGNLSVNGASTEERTAEVERDELGPGNTDGLSDLV